MDDPLRLVTRADDAGNTESANRAIRETFEDGVLRNASVMAPCPAFEDAADRLAGLDGLCVGVHVTLTAEWDRPRWGPVLPPEEVPSLVDDDGYFPPTPTALAKSQPDTDEMLAEARAQLARLRDAGFEVSYFDDHMRHRGPLLYEAPEFVTGLRELAAEEGLIDGQTAVPRLPYVEGTRATYGEQLRDRIEAGVGRSERTGQRAFLAVGHPGYYDAETRPITGGRADRGPGEWAAVMDGQRRMFLDDAVAECCAERGVEPARFTDVRTPPA